MNLLSITDKLARRVDALKFSAPVAYVYNPLKYARGPLEQYFERYGGGKKKAVLVGMNPGPFGMAQVGVPFGDVVMVRDWLNLDGVVTKPEFEHPKRPVDGFDCTRREVSGTRLWTWAKDQFGTPDKFFSKFLVVNYCPLVFMEEGGRNRTPDKLAAVEQKALFDICDEALRQTVEQTKADFAIGIGAFAQKRCKAALVDKNITIGRVLHPSPASPAANRGWAEQATMQLDELGVL
jgi:single-strand selective monofunctional uracil DNA glycosylase